ncbi:MAG: ribbon-helix-helix protein, CopG family, partial [Blautia wexlerae]
CLHAGKELWMKTTSDHDQPRRANNMQHNPVVSVRIDQELDRRLTALAEKTHRSRGAYLRAALTWALPHFEMQLQGDRLLDANATDLDAEFARVLEGLNLDK